MESASNQEPAAPEAEPLASAPQPGMQYTAALPAPLPLTYAPVSGVTTDVRLNPSG